MVVSSLAARMIKGSFKAEAGFPTVARWPVRGHKTAEGPERMSDGGEVLFPLSQKKTAAGKRR
jgi:hypothetical protein